MKNFEDMLYKQDGYIITGFINSRGNLEHNIYKQVDGGVINLKDRTYHKCKLLNLLELELEDFVNRNMPTLFILGHKICLELANGEDIMRSELDDEVYEISHSIMQDYECGEIFIKSKNLMCTWKIV